MARPLRIEYDGAVYHVTSRGNERRRIYRDDEDRGLFLSILQRVNEKYHWYCHAYCLMDNHYHLVIETPDGNLAKGMRQLNGVYTQAYNKRKGRVGHLFQGRYKAIVVEKEGHLLEICRYVVLNPVRAKAVKKAKEWRWSSYRGTAGLEAPHPCLTVDWVLGQFGTKRTSARKKYEAFIFGGMHVASPWESVRGQIVLGDERFTEKMRQLVGDREEVQEIPKGQRYLNRPRLKELFNEDPGENKKRRNDVVREAIELYGYRQSEVASFLGMHYTTVSRIMNER